MTNADEPILDRTNPRAGAVKDLRLLANVLNQEADSAVTAGRPVRPGYLEFAASAIYAGAAKGLLDDIFDLADLVDPAVLSTLGSGRCQSLPEHVTGSPGPEHVVGTIESFIAALDATAEGGAGPEESQGAEGSPALPLGLSGADAAESLLAAAWRHVCREHRDAIPANAAQPWVDEPPGANFWVTDVTGFRKVAFVCEFLADHVARGGVGDSVGWVTVADAEKLTGINRGVLSRACNNGELEGNGEAGVARRISVPDLVRYAVLHRERALDRREGEPVGPSRPSLLTCDDCGADIEVPRNCPKCRGGKLKPGRRT